MVVKEDAALQDELKAAFQLFDRDGKGIVQTADLKAILYSLGIKMTKTQIASLMLKDSKDGYVTLDLAEFVALVGDVVRKRKVVDEDDEVSQSINGGSRTGLAAALPHIRHRRHRSRHAGEPEASDDRTRCVCES